MIRMKMCNVKHACLLFIVLMISTVMLFTGCDRGNDRSDFNDAPQIESESSDVKFKDVSSESLSYQIPKNWKKISKTDNTIVGNVISYDTKDSSIMSIQAASWDQIKASPFGEFYSEIDEFLNGEISSIKYSENVSDLTESEVTVAGIKGIALDYSYKSEDKSSKQKDILFVTDNMFYRISISDVDSINMEVFDAIINSIKLD